MIKEKRNTNIEILRIISMLMIIISHYTVHNGIAVENLSLGINRYLLEISELGNIGVIIFVMITGYFSISKLEQINIIKILKIYFQVLFYSLGIYLVFILLGIEKFSIVSSIKCVLPIVFNEYWFVTTFVILLIIMPFLNILVDKLDKKQYLNLILWGVLIVSIIPFFTTQKFATNEITQFILFYLLGGYLKKYPTNINKKYYYYLLVVAVIMLLGSVLAFDLLGLKYNIFARKATYLYSRYSPVAILLSLSLLGIFSNKKPFTNKFINKISSYTFGIYLLHDNNFIRKVLWTDIVNVESHINSNYLWLHILMSVIIIFVICALVECIRINTAEVVTNKLLKICAPKISDKTSKYKTSTEEKTEKLDNAS